MTAKSEAQKTIEAMAGDQLAALKKIADVETERRGVWDRVPSMSHNEFETFKSEQFARAEKDRRAAEAAAHRAAGEKAVRDRSNG